MLTELKKLEKLLQTLQKQLPKIVEKAVRKNKDYILWLNQSQLKAGLDSDDRTLGTYAIETIRLKESNPKRTLTGYNISLYDTGSFHNKMKLAVKDMILTIDSGDKKRDMLTHFYGENILGLDETSINLLIEKIMPEIINEISELINGVR